MKLKITTILPDSKVQAPGFEIETGEELFSDIDVGNIILDELINDAGDYYKVGTTVTIERVE